MRGVAGLTLGRRVYLDPSVINLPASKVEAILRHEAVHVTQCRRHGTFVFLARYVFEYLLNRMKGLTPYSAYRAISFEREAYGEELMSERTENKNA